MSQRAPSNDEIGRAFFSVANSLNKRLYHSKWIPLEYWIFRVNLKLHNGLGVSVKATKLKKIAEQYSTTITHLDTNIRGRIVNVQINQRKVKHRRDSIHPSKDGRKKKFFIKVESQLNVPDEMDGLDDDKRTQLYQHYYNKFTALLKSTVYALDENGNLVTKHQEQQQERTSLTNTDISQSIQTNSSVQETQVNPNRVDVRVEPIVIDADELQPTKNTAARLVTPVAANQNALEKAANKDIREILSKVLNPEVLRREDLLVGDGDEACETLRREMHKFGRLKQREQNDREYRALEKDGDLAELVDRKKYEPFFAKFSAPFLMKVVKAWLYIAHKMDCENPSMGLLSNIGETGKAAHGKSALFFAPATKEKTFHDNGKVWLPKLHKAIDIDGKIDMYTFCFRLMILIWTQCKAAFDVGCRTKGPIAKNFKMDPHRQIAMCHVANISLNQLRQMRPFLMADNCNPFTSEKEIRTLVEDPDIMPIFSEIIEFGMKRNAFHLPVNEIVKSVLANLDLGDDNTRTSFDELHLIFSADHGQGAFRCNLSAVGIQSSKKTVVYERHILVGKIECRKDTREVVVNSGVLPGINTGLTKLKSEDLYCVGCDEPLNVKLKAVGDLAFFLMAQGRENMSGQHCFRCDAMHKHFQEDPFYMGERWTVSSMQERYDKLESGTLKRSNKAVQCGVTHPNILPAIEIQEYIVPILHSVDLLVNHVVEYFQKYCWYRIEDTPLELIIARIYWADADKEHNKKQELREKADLDHAECLMQLKTLKAAGFLEDDELFREHQRKAEAASEWKKLVSDKLAEVRKELKEAKSNLSRLEKDTKNYGKATRALWMKIERELKEQFNVYWSVYHGGALEGVQARAFVRHIVDIMKMIKALCMAFLDSLSQNEQNERADERELDLYFGGFQRLFQYMDLISHFCYQPYGSMNDSDVEDAKKCIRMATKLWWKLLPTVPMKVHAWQHLAEDLEKYRGLKSHHEQEIERAHQRGKKDERRVGNLKDFKKKTLHLQRQAATVASKGVQEKIADTNSKRVRKKKRKLLQTTVEAKTNRAAYLKGILRLPEITSDFPTLLELQKKMPRTREEEEALL